ncbi:hemicentin-1-like isoform X2 [Dysidea avara]|uniref:hemicentin-1-like isoform X2 n=1 Tax=Dysidea avara TaxID=196820 RepID=UPI0033181E3C
MKVLTSVAVRATLGVLLALGVCIVQVTAQGCPSGMVQLTCSWNLTCTNITTLTGCDITPDCTSGCFCSNRMVLIDGMCSNASLCSVHPPNITSPIDNSTTTVITEGDTTTITCEAIGYPPPTIVWSRTGGTLSNRVSVSNSVSVPTGNGNVTSVSVNLTLTNANREDTGTYMCLATSSPYDASRYVTITVQASPIILSNISDLTDEGRDVANFTCQAIGEPVPTISWYFNGVMIDVSDTSKYRIESRSINTTTTENTLTVYNVTSSNVGTYTCNATNIIGTDYSHGCLAGMDYQMSGVQLTCDALSSVDNCSNATSESGCFCSNGNVLEDGVCIRPGECPIPPSITAPLENTTTVITEGDTTTITCEAIGYPPPTIVWTKTSGTLSDRVSVSDSVSAPTGSGNVTSVSVNLTMTNANREDTGLYECSTSNSVGSDNRNISVTVQFVPAILSDVDDSTDEGRDVANFTCQATGEPVPTISWYFDGVMIDVSDASKYRIESRSINTTTTENTLTVYNVTSSNVGTYTCNATNIVGSEYSHGCLAGMDYQMSGVQLTCDDLSSLNNCSNTTSESGCFCSNGNVLLDGVCIHPNVCPIPPNIRVPLENTTTVITEGDTTTITCETIGYPPPTIEWSRISGTLSDRVSVSDSVSAPTEIGNVTSVSVNLTMTNANREDTGLYECSTSNSVGSDNRNISVTVQFVPAILSDVDDSTDEGRDVANFTCQATGEPVPTISWYFDGVMIDVSDTSKYRIESRSINTTTTEKTLTVYNVTSSNVGTYTCNATNIIGSDYIHGCLAGMDYRICDFHICCDDLSGVDNCSNTTCESGCFCSNGNVLLDGVCIHPNVCPIPPSIRVPLENATTVITEGDTTTITCEAVGYPPPTIEWSRISGTLSDRVSVSDSVSVPTGNGNVTSVRVNLTLTNANREDTGLYECSSSNSIGSDNRNTSVTVQFSPDILSDIMDLSDERRDIVNFTCQAIGEPVPIISWYFSGVMIDVSDTSKYRIESRSINTTTAENTLTVYNATETDVGAYTCNATNFIGSDSTHGCLAGMDYRICDVHITCGDLSSVDNCTNTTCDSGCFCSNGNVLLDSVCIHPDVCPIPSTIITPMNSTTTVITEGDTTIITCEAIGYPPPTVEWSRTNGTLSDRVSVSSVSVPTGNGNVTSVSVNLTLTNANREDTGLYECSASNSVGSDNRNISVTVQYQPEIIVQLSDQIENETNPTSFVCQAIGEPVPEISWYFNGAMINVSDTSKYTVTSVSVNISTALSTLNIFNAASADVGTYVCNATNVVGGAKSVAVLTINDAAELVEPLPPGRTEDVQEGLNVTLTCIGAGHPPPHVQWRKIDGTISNRTTISNSIMSTNEGNVTRVTVELTITGSYRDDSGSYECSVSNLLNTITSTVNLTIQFIPEILLNITDLTDEGRDIANFTCQATGEPVPTISWHFNGVMIDVSDSSKYRIESRPINTTTTENTLTVYNATEVDVGTYTCDATNMFGSDSSHGCLAGMEYQLCGWQVTCDSFTGVSNCSNLTCESGCFCSNGNVLLDGVCIHPNVCPIPPNIRAPLENTTTVITEGDTTTITCEAIGYPPPTIVWTKTSGTLSDRVSVSDSVSAPTGSGNVTSVSVNLTMTNANREDTGLYECSASNSVGSDNRNTSVTVQFEPTILFEIVDSTDEGRDVANFTCQATSEPVPTISWYFKGVMIDVSDTSKYRIESRSINTTTTENTLTVYNVTSSNVGTYTCNATNIIGTDSLPGCLAGMDYRMCDFHICCDDLSGVDNCSNTTCESGCFCSNGNVLLDGVCIHPNVCPIPPSIRAPLENTTTVITEGDTTTITCEAIGYPPPTVVWSRTSGTLSDRVLLSDSVSVPTGNGNVTSVSVNLTMTNANREDTGLYECSASNSVGSDNRNTSVTVQFAPAVLSEIVDSTDDGRDVANFTCEATGEPIPDISWYFNGVMIDMSDTSKYRIESRSLNTTTTENTLTVYNVTSSNVGTYTCNSTNTIGTDNSHGCLAGMDYRLCDWEISCSNFSSINNCSNLTCTSGCFCSNGNVLEDGVCIHPNVCPIPTMIITPMNSTTTVMAEGDTTTITCEAIGYPPPTIVWSRTNGTLSGRVSVSDSVSVPTGNGNVTSVSVNLTLTNANREDTGLYECSSSNSVGSDNRNISVTVQFHPAVVSDVNDLTDEERNIANFTCQAIGEPVPFISWYFNGVMMDVSDTSKYRIESRSINTTTTENTLTVYNVTSFDVGTYTCNATNIIGNNYSHGCLAGMEYQMCGWEVTCNHFRRIGNCSNVTCESGCFCSNGNVLEDGVCIHPDVCPISPSIRTPSENTTTVITEGDTTTITCEAIGYPPPTIEWSRTSGTLSGRVSVSDSVSVPTGNGNVTSVSVNLTMTNANREDTGLYECSASNSIGSDSANTSVTVQYLPEIIVQLSDQLENETNPTSFVCQAIGEPVPEISWYFNGAMINVSDTSKYTVTSVSVNISTTQSTLNIFNAASVDVGTYVCNATNVAGSARSTAVLTINDAAELVEPLPPGRTQDTQEGLNITLTCIGAGHPPPHVKWRKVDGTISNRTTISNSVMSTNEGNVTRVTVELIITGAYRDDSGSYECSVSNLLNTVTGTVNLTVQFASSIINTIVDNTVNETDSVNFICQATGEPVPNIIWDLNGVMINMSDTSKYRIESRSINTTTTENTVTVYNVTSYDVGTYTCNATNIIGSDESSGTLTVHVSTQIILPTEGVTFYTQEGQTITLSCVSTGYPPPVVVWKRNGIDLTTTNSSVLSTNMGNVTEVTTNVTLTDVNRGYTDDYTCSATNLLATDITIITLIVEFQPEIVLELYDLLENETNPTSFTCQATGEPVPNITWYYNGVMINDMSNVSNTSKYRIDSREINITTIEGTLEIYNASSFDVGTYVCIATNELGSDRSVGILTIHDAAEIVEPLPPGTTQDTQEGLNITLTCIGTGHPPPHVEWRKVDGTISNRTTISNSIMSTNKGNVTRVTVELTITGSYRDDSGSYECSVSNLLNTVTGTVSLTVQFQPEIYVEVTDQLENETYPVMLTCQATGEPVPNISWYFNGVMINVSDTSKYRIESRSINTTAIEGRLEVFNATSSDVGTYVCIATNGLGSDRSVGVLTVNDAAELVEPLEGRAEYTQEGLNITLTCNGVGYPPPEIEWRKVDGTISNRTTISNSIMSTNEGNVTRVTVELTITGSYRDDSGSYECSVSNLLNTVTSTVNLTVQFASSIINTITDNTVNETDSVNFICQATGEPVPNIVWDLNEVMINMSDTSKYRIESRSINTTTTENTVTVYNVTSYDVGTYTCNATNIIGSDESSGTLTVHVSTQIILPPEGETFYTQEGQTITLSCVSTGYPPPVVVWQRNGIDLTTTNSSVLSTNMGNVTEVTTNVTLTDVNRGYTDDYTCSATNLLATDITIITLIVEFQPEIVVELYDQLENETNPTSFTCQATGEPIPNITWFYNGVMINDMSNVSNTSKYRIDSREINITTIEGTLEIYNASSFDVGTYVCIATNELGSNRSVGILTIHDAAEIVEPLPPGTTQDTQEGLNITLTCIGAGHPPPHVEWRKVDGTISNRATISNSSMSTNKGNVTRVTTELIITGSYRDDSGSYECSFSNLLNTVTGTVNLTVQFHPEIVAEVINSVTNETNLDTFTCQATGEPVPNITWYFNGVVMDVSDTSKYSIESRSINTTTTGNTLIVYNVTSSNVGTYTCNATNIIGSDFIGDVQSSGILTVYVSPNITSPPEGETFYTQERHTTTLSCVSTGYPPPVVVWKRNGIDLTTTNTSVLSTNMGNVTEVTANVTLTDVNRDITDYYTCSAANLLNVDITNVSLVVQFHAEITVDISDQLEENETNSVSFLCEAIGEPVPNISWYFNGVMINVSDTSKYKIEPRSINTTTTETLTVNNVTSFDVGTYICNATNIIATDTSIGVLTVNDAAEMIEPLPPGITQDTQEGSNVTLTCIGAGHPPPHVEWGKVDGTISNRTTISNSSMSTNKGNVTRVTVELTITGSYRDDSGGYECSVSNLLNTVTSTVNLTVQFASSIINTIANNTINETDSVNFTCRATGEPVPNIAWDLNGIMINISDTSKYRIESRSINTTTTENTLTVYNVTSSNVGTYTCNATNIIGSNLIADDQTSGYLEVNVAPSIEHPVNDGDTFLVPQDDNITIKCSATGYPSPSLQWIRQGAELDDDERFSVVEGQEEFSVITNITRVTIYLVITSASRDDIDQYICIAKNLLDDVNRTITVFVQYHVNIESQSGLDVINNSIINAFTNEVKSIVLHCVTVRRHENAKWMHENDAGLTITQLSSTTYNSTIQINDTGEGTDMNMLQLTCLSEHSKEHRAVYVTRENPFLRLNSERDISSIIGTRPIIMYTIAVDADGTREGQKNLSSIASLSFRNSSGQNLNKNEDLFKFTETSFQNYDYPLPPLDSNTEGNYILTIENSDGNRKPETVSVQVEELEEEIELTVLSSRITILEGDRINMSCIPSNLEIAIEWKFSDREIVDSAYHQLTPQVLNHYLTIPQLDASDNGTYTCAVAITERVEKTITLNIVPTCLEDYSNGLRWPTTRRNTVRALKCSELHPSLRPGVNIERFCKHDGNWDTIDFSACTALPDAISIVIVSFKVNVSESAAEVVAENVTDQFKSSNNISFSNYKIMYYPLTLSDNTGVSIKFNTSDDISVINDISQTLPSTVMNSTYEVNIYIPGSNCSCLAESDRRTICKGPSRSPCNCTADTCECVSPFVGKDGSCGIDSDGDGFPDVQLNCAGLKCEKDICVDDYSVFPDGTQNELICNPPVIDEDTFTGCYPENDTQWDIRWPTAERGEEVIQKCPGGAESLGLASRKCDGDPAEWQEPDVNNCSTVEITRIMEEAERLDEILKNALNSENADLTIMVEPEVVEAITEELASLTDNEETILPNDLANTLGTIDSLISVSEAIEVDQNTLENLVDATSNIIDPSNMVAFGTLENMDSGEDEPEPQNSVGAKALRNTARLSEVIGSTLKAEGNQSASITIVTNNVVIDAQVLSETDLDSGANISFPNEGSSVGNVSASSTVPSEALRKYPGPVTNTYLSDPFFLPNNFDGNGQFNLSSAVLVVQLTTSSSNPNDTSLPEDSNLQLDFDISEDKRLLCVFWQEESGTWSDRGLTIERNDSSNVTMCQSTHLTSFAVMVDVQGAQTQSKALSFISYIGCGISIFSLILTMLAITFWRKTVYKGVHNINHFNLALSLLIGLIIFTSSIESAKDNEVACGVFAGLLHYFFLAAFAWMLCEGIYLFVHLNFVFYDGFFTKWYFFFGLGYGLPVPIVAIAAGIAHDNYGTDRACWLSEKEGTMWAFVGPMLLIVAVNFIFLLISLRIIYKSKKNNIREEGHLQTAKSLVIAAVVMLPLLGATWVIGLFAVNEETTIFAWIFTILNSLQGFFIFFFYVVRQEKIRASTKDRFRTFTNSFSNTLKRGRTLSEGYGDTSKFGTIKSARSDSCSSSQYASQHSQSDHGKFESLKSKKKDKVPEIALSSVVENPYSESSGTLSANGEFESSFQNLRALDVINEEDPPHTSTIVLNIDVGSEEDENGFEKTKL